MTAPVITVNPAATVGDAARLMLEHNVSVLPVLDAQEKLAGILTHTDFGLNPRYRPLANNIYNPLRRQHRAPTYRGCIPAGQQQAGAGCNAAAGLHRPAGCRHR